MLIQCFIRKSQNGIMYALSEFINQSNINYKRGKVMPADESSGASTIISNIIHNHPKLTHILIVVKEGDIDKYKLANEIREDKYIKDFPITVEQYPSDFTPGSFTCRNVEKMIEMVKVA